MAEPLDSLLDADPIRKGIRDSLQAIDPTFHIEPYLRILSARGDAIEEFINPNTNALDVFMIQFLGIVDAQSAYGSGGFVFGKFPWTYKIFYFRAIDDADYSEIRFANTLKRVVIEMSKDAFLGDVFPGYTELIQIDETQVASLGTSGAHRADMFLNVHDRQ